MIYDIGSCDKEATMYVVARNLLMIVHLIRAVNWIDESDGTLFHGLISTLPGGWHG